MAEPKDGGGFLRKVARFVANPSTDWKDIGAKPDDGQDLEKSELKAMIERKRRNDFVRKRELDTLRRLRREGLSPEQLAILGGSSKADDSEVRSNDPVNVRNDAGVKAKIDAIEQQMVGEGHSLHPANLPRRTPVEPKRTAPPGPAAQRAQSDFYRAPPAATGDDPPVSLPSLDHLPPLPRLGPLDMPSDRSRQQSADRSATKPTTAQAAPAAASAPSRETSQAAARTSNNSAAKAGHTMPPAPREAPEPAVGKPGLQKVDLEFATDSRFAVEVNEVVHDPELDEAVIAFANADFAHCEQSLIALCKPHAPRRDHAETWLVLFDLYRAVGQQTKFDVLTLEFVNHFARSSPQWYSLPKLVAEAAADERPDTQELRGDVGWVCPALLDVDAVAELDATTLQLPLPWVLDWTPLQTVEVEAAGLLQDLFRQWAPQPLDMRWIAGDRLISALHEAAPTSVRDADPAFWMARLEALRLCNRPDQFDEAAIDYCVTYEVSPPSWESSRCVVRSRGAGTSTSTPSLSMVSEAASMFAESAMADTVHRSQQVVSVELSGQLAGDISATLQRIDQALGHAALVSVSCARLIRVDFIAAGDLLNWVLAKQAEQRSVTFTETHRLVALFFGAMGINEHARVQLIRQ